MIGRPGQVPDALDERQEVSTARAFGQMVPNENTAMADVSQIGSNAGVSFEQTDNNCRVNFGNDSQRHVSERDDEMTELAPDASSDPVAFELPKDATVEMLLDLANKIPWDSWAGMEITSATMTLANGRIVGNMQWIADNPGYLNFVDGREWLKGPEGSQFLEEYGSIAIKNIHKFINDT